MLNTAMQYMYDDVPFFSLVVLCQSGQTDSLFMSGHYSQDTNHKAANGVCILYSVLNTESVIRILMQKLVFFVLGGIFGSEPRSFGR